MIGLYLLKSTVCLFLIMVFYHVFLQYEKMYRFNRFYLLFGLILSVLVPFLPTGFTIVDQGTNSVIFQENIFLTPEMTDPLAGVSHFWTVENALWGVYISVLVLLVIRFVKNVSQMLQKSNGKERVYLADSTLILQGKKEPPHTFLTHIFLNKSAYEREEIESSIIIHERTHARELHTIDVLLVEILKTICWFQLLLYKYKEMIQLNHEYLADHAVIQKYPESTHYKRLLVQLKGTPTANYMASNINFKVTKKRIQMMNKQYSRWKVGLYAATTLPFLFALMLLFGQKTIAQNNNSDNRKEFLELYLKEQYSILLKLMVAL